MDLGRWALALLPLAWVGCASSPALDPCGGAPTPLVQLSDAGPGAIRWPLAQAADPRCIFQQPRLVTLLPPAEPLAPELIAFGDSVFQTQWWRAWSADYGIGAPAPTAHFSLEELAPGPTDASAMAAAVDRWILDSGVAPDDRTVYVVYLPEGASFFHDGGVPLFTGSWCQPFHGIHQQDFLRQARRDNVAYVQRCVASDQDGGYSVLDYLTEVASHELAEAVTDPSPPQGYVLPIEDHGDEVGDACGGTAWRENGFTFQRIWSNLAASAGGDPCAPARPEPYFNVSLGQSVYTAPHGGSVTVQVTGWASAATADWQVSADWGGLAPELDGIPVWALSPTPEPDAGWPSLNAGRTVSLTVPLPTFASQGALLTLRVRSFRSGDLPGAGLADAYHVQWATVQVQ